MQQLLRLLEVIRRELGAVDARAEIGGAEPADPRLLFCSLPGGLRLVAVFDQPPDGADALRDRLESLAASFAELAPTPAELGGRRRELAWTELDGELEVLASRAGACQALVIDVGSPVVWGSSAPERREDGVPAAIEAARAWEQAVARGFDLAELLELDQDALVERLAGTGAERLAGVVARLRGGVRRSRPSWQRHLLASRAIQAVRAASAGQTSTAHLKELVRRDGFAYFARGFGSIYWLVLVFEGQLSELGAEGAVLHALPIIERLVLALPPLSPPPGARKGRLIRLDKPR